MSDERKKRLWWPRVAIVPVVLVLYVLSYGPFQCFLDARVIPSESKVADIFYAPLDWILETFPIAQDWFRIYVALWPGP